MLSETSKVFFFLNGRTVLRTVGSLCLVYKLGVRSVWSKCIPLYLLEKTRLTPVSNLQKCQRVNREWPYNIHIHHIWCHCWVSMTMFQDTSGSRAKDQPAAPSPVQISTAAPASAHGKLLLSAHICIVPAAQDYRNTVCNDTMFIYFMQHILILTQLHLLP